MSLAVAMARAIKVRVRSGDLAGGQLRPGAGHEILGRRRDMNLRALAQGMGVEMPAVVEGGGGRVVRPGDEDLTEIQRQREADQANRPEVGLRDILTNAGVTDEKLDGFKPAELFKILQPAGRAALVRALDTADRAALYRALDIAGRAALVRALDTADRADLFRVSDDADRATLVWALGAADRVALFGALGTADRAALRKALDGDSQLALAVEIIAQSEK